MYYALEASRVISAAPHFATDFLNRSSLPPRKRRGDERGDRHTQGTRICPEPGNGSINRISTNDAPEDTVKWECGLDQQTVYYCSMFAFSRGMSEIHTSFPQAFERIAHLTTLQLGIKVTLEYLSV